MTRIGTALLVLWCSWATPSLAEELTAAKRADIEQLLQMTGALGVGQQMSTAVVGQMMQVLRKARPDIPERVLKVLPEEVNAVIEENLGNLKEVVIPLYHKYFTGEEIKEMIRFYSTPLGKKTIEVMPVLVNESFQAGQQWGQQLGPVIQTRVQARLKKEGYDLQQQAK
jgi:hypothetical protein